VTHVCVVAVSCRKGPVCTGESRTSLVCASGKVDREALEALEADGVARALELLSVSHYEEARFAGPAHVTGQHDQIVVIHDGVVVWRIEGDELRSLIAGCRAAARAVASRHLRIGRQVAERVEELRAHLGPWGTRSA